MNKSVFKISKMDCPSEEAMIRIKLQSIRQIIKLNFDIPNRKLTVYHNGNIEEIHNEISELKFDEQLIASERTTETISDDSISQRKVLWTVLVINAIFFILEMTTGLLSNSMGLVADSLDMLADSFVYSLSLLAVGGSILRKKSIAKIAGYFQIVLAVIGFFEVLRRFLFPVEVPDFRTMIIVSILALMANVVCLTILQKSKSKEAHMRASMIFTSNDIIINTGVIMAGILVLLTKSQIPDLIVGGIVFVIVIQGAKNILKLG
ncbi:cation transporter [Muriicola sp. Z0-33]|uniref:cation transporter n=1 Tax=Muriicola sp. Z0-33 TaxID=2816957 RepID=UPI002238DE29|nr:cation transporter [Muriicola sp. Z0-33]MCW5515477.1 cation transporter [Muriicola sp. Z0-33]